MPLSTTDTEQITRSCRYDKPNKNLIWNERIDPWNFGCDAAFDAFNLKANKIAGKYTPLGTNRIIIDGSSYLVSDVVEYLNKQ